MKEDQSIDNRLLSDHAKLGDRLQVTASGLLVPDWPGWTNPVSGMPGLSPGPVTVLRSSFLHSPQPQLHSATLTQQQTTGAAALPALNTHHHQPRLQSQ